jgi:deoxyadenosine/deoxycytidine kinase
MSQKPFTVLVEGNIGCGKSTLLRYFSKFPNIDILQEPVERWQKMNYLKLFYDNPQRWGFAFQTYVQLTQTQNHWHSSQNPIKIMERSLFSSRFIFIEHLLKNKQLHQVEYETLSQWFQFLTTSPEIRIDLIVYIRTRPEKALERVRIRGRQEENCIKLPFLREIHQLHENWLMDHKFPLPAPVLVIEADQSLEFMPLIYKNLEDIILGDHLYKMDVD